MLNYIVRAGDLPCDYLASICLNFYPPKSALYIIVALVFRIIVNKKKSVTYCQQVLFIVKVHVLCHDDPHEFKLDYYRGAGFHSVNRKYV